LISEGELVQGFTEDDFKEYQERLQEDFNATRDEVKLLKARLDYVYSFERF